MNCDCQPFAKKSLSRRAATNKLYSPHFLETLNVSGRQVPVSNLDKIFYPGVGFTKAQVIDYYIRIASVLLPHLKDRPLTLKRYPDGVAGGFFMRNGVPSIGPVGSNRAGVE